ncbi:MAG: septum site-determining protein MinC [Clostridia bacterium]
MIKIKGTTEGLRMIIDQGLVDRGEEALESSVSDRLLAADDFFEGADLTVELPVPALQPSIVASISRAVGASTSSKLVGIIARDPSDEVFPPKEVDFHVGNLRSGQTLTSSRTLVVFGNVNPGARVAAVGDVYVAGTLGGFAVAGSQGDASRVIYAGSMRPLQLRISSVMARGMEPGEFSGPECAVIEGDRISLYPARDIID